MKNFVGARAFPENLEYYRPGDVAEALNLLNDESAEIRVIAGGTDVVPMVRRGALALGDGARLIDVTGIRGFRDIRKTEGWIYLGPAVTLATLLDSSLIAEHASILAQAARQMASPQIRNTATIGGNLCTASPGADTAPPLLALDAEVLIKNKNHERYVSLADYFTSPGRTVMTSGELLVGIRFPTMKANEGACYIKMGRRKTFTLSVVSVAAKLTQDGDIITDARIAVGAAGPTPMRAYGAEKALIGSPYNDQTIEAASQAVIKEINPRTSARASIEYRQDMAGVLTRRVLTACSLVP